MAEKNMCKVESGDFSVFANVKAYNGDIMNMCVADLFDFTDAYAVVVSGAKWNPCGHLILNTGGTGGWYFHIAEARGYPRYMNEAGYQKYLRMNSKTELRRFRVSIPRPNNALQKLEELLANKWTWFILPHNCASFVEDVIRAGGSKAGLYFNCPSKEQFN